MSQDSLKDRLIKARILSFDESRLHDYVYAALMEQCLLIVSLPRYADETHEIDRKAMVTLIRDLAHTLASGVSNHGAVAELLQRAKQIGCYP